MISTEAVSRRVGPVPICHMNVMSLLAVGLAAVVAAAVPPSLLAAGSEESPDPATRLLRDASLMLLKEGNARYVAGRLQHPHLDAERRSTTAAQGQEPFATILACSDSREPVELIFDRGVGDLFVVRVAGNIAGVSELGTVEYGVGHLNTPVLVVLGHTRCETVTAVVKGTELHGHIQALAEKIKPAVAKVTAETLDPEEALPKAIQANVWQTIEDIIKQSRGVRDKLRTGRLSILGAVYDVEQGKVSWLGLHPAQSSLVALADQAETDPVLARKLNASLSKGPAEGATSRGGAPVARRAPTVAARESDAAVPPAVDEHRPPPGTQSPGKGP